MPEVLYEMVVEVEERIVLHKDDCQLNLSSDLHGTTGEKVHSNVAFTSVQFYYYS